MDSHEPTDDLKIKKKALKNKIIGGSIIGIIALIAIGPDLIQPLLLERKYKNDMLSCMDDTAYLQQSDAKTDESKICTCAVRNSPATFSDKTRIEAYSRAKQNFYKQTKARYNLSSKLLLCEARDFINQYSK